MEPDALPTNVTTARDKALESAGVAGDFASKSYTIEDELKKVVQEALDYNKDVIALRSGALADYFEAGPKAEAKYGVKTFGTGPQTGQENQDFIFNPFERNAAVAQYTKGTEIPFLFANTLLGQREGTIADVVGAGTRAFQANATAQERAAAVAQQAYQTALQEFTTQKDIGFKERATRVAEMDAQTNRIQANKSGGGGGQSSPVDKYTALSTAMASVAQQLQQIKEGQGGKITREQVKQQWNAQIPTLSIIGVDSNSIASAMNSMLSADEVVDSLPSEGISQLSAPLKELGSATMKSPWETFFKTPSVPLPSTANISRGISNVASFIKGFQQ